MRYLLSLVARAACLFAAICFGPTQLFAQPPQLALRREVVPVNQDEAPQPDADSTLLPRARSEDEILGIDPKLLLAPDVRDPAPLRALITPEQIAAQPVTPLSLDEVLAALDDSFPLLFAAAEERGITAGELLASYGAFDTKVKLWSINQPLGFYKNYRQGVSFDQPTTSGGSVYGGYKIGRGKFEPWYKERLTNEGGEFSAGFELPLYKNRVIDKRRAEVAKADIKRRLAEPKIQKAFLDYSRAASVAYWSWVASGQAEQVADDMLQIAQDRDAFIGGRVDKGDMAPIERIDNARVIASRQASVVAARRKTQKAALDLSLFLRDADGQPVLVNSERLPPGFPKPVAPQPDGLQQDIALATSLHPDITRLRLLQEQTRVEMDVARNDSLPNVAAFTEASKDMGAPADTPDDKGPFVLQAGFMLDVPLQRRQAHGDLRAAKSRLAQLRNEEQYATDAVVMKVQDAVGALDAAYERLGFAERGVDLARQTEEAEWKRLRLGQSNVLTVNLRELATAEAELVRIGAIADYFFALADYYAALGIGSRRQQPKQ